MSKHNVEVTILGTVQSVPVIDTPVSIEVTFEGQTTVVLPAAGPYVANFVVDEGTYNGTIQSIRADGSLIGTPIAFNVTVAADTVEAFVPSSVSVVVTPYIAPVAVSS